MENKRLAELLFPGVTKDAGYYEGLFPVRNLKNGAKVTRLAPSPTGFIHLGNLYGAFVDERLARQSGGVFYLRIEDTDDKRFVEGAVEAIISSLDFFGISFDEGAAANGDSGVYGPYYQSKRAGIYQCYVKQMINNDQAYPCFLSEEEITDIRKLQEKNKETPGIYGKWAASRELDYEQVEAKIKSGTPYVIRLKSKGSNRQIQVDDGIRGTLVLPENYHDVVILKKNGIPTYHFAHAIDDHLMRTTHVVRGEEWLSSLPIHVELFNMLSFPMPVFCHTAQLMKLGADGNKRKLSKREDPELSLSYYRNEGYHPDAVREYLLTIINSNFEEWRGSNPGSGIDEFPFTLEKMSVSGALFDLNKLDDVCKDVLLKIPAAELRKFMVSWAREFKPEAAAVLERDEEYIEKILNIGRNGDNPRKDLVFARQIFEFMSYFFDEYFVIKDEIPPNVSNEDAGAILRAYLSGYSHSDDQAGWFDIIREIGTGLGYAAKPKDHKKDPGLYKGHVGHVSTVIRIALTGRAQSPDIWEIQQILGEQRTRSRVLNFIETLPSEQ